jgi:hypothetical protein
MLGSVCRQIWLIFSVAALTVESSATWSAGSYARTTTSPTIWSMPSIALV